MTRPRGGAGEGCRVPPAGVDAGRMVARVAVGHACGQVDQPGRECARPTHAPDACSGSSMGGPADGRGRGATPGRIAREARQLHVRRMRREAAWGKQPAARLGRSSGAHHGDAVPSGHKLGCSRIKDKPGLLGDLALLDHLLLVLTYCPDGLRTICLRLNPPQLLLLAPCNARIILPNLRRRRCHRPLRLLYRCCSAAYCGHRATGASPPTSPPAPLVAT